jgi:hypothetical protein
MSSSLATHVRRVALTGTAVFLTAVSWAGPAAAAGSGGVSGVVNTGGGRVNIRSGPSTSAEVIRTRPNSTRLVLLCQVKGEKIRGHRRTTAMWNKVKGGGYVSDAYVKRGKVPPPCKTKEYSTSGTAPSVKQMHPFGLPDAQKSFVPSTEQMDNAKIIMETGRKLGLPPRAWVIAIATSLQESTLHNHGHLGKRNDHDSLGLFQQRPSMGWGKPEQVTDPVYASTKFYGKLTRLSNWEQLPLYKAAQRVQVSAFPKAYRKWEKQAGEIVQGLYGNGRYANIT